MHQDANHPGTYAYLLVVSDQMKSFSYFSLPTCWKAFLKRSSMQGFNESKLLWSLRYLGMTQLCEGEPILIKMLELIVNAQVVQFSFDSI